MALGATLVIAHAKAMASGCILDITVIDTCCRQGFVQKNGVAVVDYRVIYAIDKKNRGTILGNMPFKRERVLQLGIVDTQIS